MKNYVVYNRKGEIKKSGQCSTAKFERLKKKKKLILEGVGNDKTHKVENGKLVRKKTMKVKPPKPEFLPAIISKEQWQDVLRRLNLLESKL